MMSLLNEIYDAGARHPRRSCRTLLMLLNPFAPHVTEEMWERAGLRRPDAQRSELAAPTTPPNAWTTQVEIAVQVSGKIKTRIMVPADDRCSRRYRRCQGRSGNGAGCSEGKTIVKEIYVPGKLVNIVAK